MRPELRTAIWSGGGLVFALVALVAVPSLGAEGAALAVVSAFAVAAWHRSRSSAPRCAARDRGIDRRGASSLVAAHGL